MENAIETCNILDGLRKRVQAVDPNQGRCMVQNVLPVQGEIEHCYLIPRQLMYNDDAMEYIEWNWNMRKGTLNLDTRYNVFPAGPSICALYESHKFVLVPDEDIVLHYKESLTYPRSKGRTRRERFPQYNDDKYEYRLIPILDMESVTISRRDDSRSDSSTPYTYPFDTLPKLISHIRPNFVIFATGHRLKLGDISIKEMWNRFPILRPICFLHTFWTQRIPYGEGYTDKTFYPEYFPGNSDDDDKNGYVSDSRSVRTAKGRGYIRRLPDLPLPEGSCRSHHIASETTDDDNNEVTYSDGSRAGDKRRSKTPPGRGGLKMKKRKLTKRPCLTEDKTRMWDGNGIAEWAKSVDNSYVVPDVVIHDPYP